MTRQRRPKTQRELILDGLKTSDLIFFDDRRALGRWMQTLRELQREGLVKLELREIDEQYSRLEVRRP